MDLPPPPQQAYRATRDEFAAFLVAYVHLLAFRWDALDRHLHPRRQPVSLGQLAAQGVREHVLFWMLYQDHVEHLRPPPGRAAAYPVASLLLDGASAFALTE